MSRGLNRGLEAILWGLGVKGISPTAFRVLLRLCARVNGEEHRLDYDVWPSHNNLAEEAEISPSGVKRHLKELEDAGFITMRAGGRHDGSRSVNCYTLMVHGPSTEPGTCGPPAFTPIGQSDLCLGQSDLGHRSGVTHAQVTADLCNEPSNGTSEIEDSPLSYGEDTPTQEIDLFGKQGDAPKIELHDQVVTAWNELAKRRPGIAAISTLNDSRRKKIYARAKDMAKVEPDGWKAWQRILTAIEASTYLCGEDPPGRGYTDPFRLNIEFALRPSEFLKIYDGGYRANRTHETHDAVSGRRFGPAEQAGRKAFARIRTAGGQRGSGGDDRGGEAADGSAGLPTGPLRSAFDQYRTD